LKLNGVDYGDKINGVHLNGTQNDGIYAPTTAGTNGQYLKSSGPNNAPTWEDMPVVTLSN